MSVQWKGYPVAQCQGDWAVDHDEHHMEINKYWLWNGDGFRKLWDAYVDDYCVGTFRSLDAAKEAYINHIKGMS
jgi:hypothetical protein